MMTNFSRILNEMTSYQADKNQIIQNLVDYPWLIIDDLGIERNSEFALVLSFAAKRKNNLPGGCRSRFSHKQKRSNPHVKRNKRNSQPGP